MREMAVRAFCLAYFQTVISTFSEIIFPISAYNFTDNYGQMRKVWKALLGCKRHQRKHLDFTRSICSFAAANC